jgi:hypothetical protein
MPNLNIKKRKSTIKPNKTLYRTNSTTTNNLANSPIRNNININNNNNNISNSNTNFNLNNSSNINFTEGGSKIRGINFTHKNKTNNFSSLENMNINNNNNNNKYESNENIQFSYSLKFSDSSFLIKNFIDYYNNLIYIENSSINKMFRENFECFKNQKEFPRKLKEFIDEDICLLIIKHFNRDSFPKEVHPIKYVLLFFILILPQMNLNINFRNHLISWISYVAETK